MKFLIPVIATLLLAASAAPLRAAGFSSETRIYKKAGDRELHLNIEKPSAWKLADRHPATSRHLPARWMAWMTRRMI
jgi:hypothetical protein